MTALSMTELKYSNDYTKVHCECIYLYRPAAIITAERLNASTWRGKIQSWPNHGESPRAGR